MRRFKEDRSGFTLLELIIVIAIMAVLVIVVVPWFFKYVEKSRQAKDLDVAAVVQRALTVAMIDPSIDDRPMHYGPSDFENIDDGSMPEFAGAVKEYVGVGNLTNFSRDNIRSRVYSPSSIIVEIDAAAELVRVTVSSNSADVEHILVE